MRLPSAATYFLHTFELVKSTKEIDNVSFGCAYQSDLGGGACPGLIRVSSGDDARSPPLYSCERCHVVEVYMV